MDRSLRSSNTLCEWSSTSVISCCYRLHHILAFAWQTSPKLSRPDALPEYIWKTPPPAVLRFQDGSRLVGNLQIISIAGGLLRLSQPLGTNTRASLMFLTDGGPVLGKAEMLSPLSHTQQAFRFISLDQNNQRNLQLGIQSHLNQNLDEEQWIAKYRSALTHRLPPTKPALKIILGSVAFGILVVLSAAHFLNFELLK